MYKQFCQNIEFNMLYNKNLLRKERFQLANIHNLLTFH